MINRTYAVSFATVGMTAFTGRHWQLSAFIIAQGLTQFAHWYFTYPEKKDD